MADLNFRIAATLDKGGFTNAASAVRGVGQASEEAAEGVEGLGNAFNLVQTAVGGFMALQAVQFLRDLVNQTIDNEQRERELKISVDNTGASFDKNKPMIDNYLKAMQNLTGVHVQELIPAFQTLIDKTGNINTAMNNLGLVIGLSKAKTHDYGEAATIVSGVIDGQSMALRRAATLMGMDAEAKKDASAVLAELTRRYGDLDAAISPMEKRMNDMSNAWKDLKESIGQAFGPIFVALMQGATRELTITTQWIRMLFDAIGTSAISLVEVWAWVFSDLSETANNAYKKMKAMQEDYKASTADAAKKLVDALRAVTEANKADVGKRAGDAKTHYLEMNEMEKKFLTESAAASAASGSEQLQKKLELLAQENQAVKQSLTDETNWGRISKQNQDALYHAADAQTRAKMQAAIAQSNAAELSQQKALMDSEIALTAAGTSKNLNLRLKELDMETAAERAAANAAVMTEADRARKMQTISNNDTAQRKKLYQEYYSSESQTADEAARAIGTSMGGMLSGQQDAWKSGLTQILQMIINWGAKAIGIGYAVGASQEVAKAGWVGVATGAALIVAGAAAAALISAISPSPSSSSSVSSSSVASASSPVAASSSSTAAAGPANGTMTVQIYGDMISDTAFIDRLTQKISSAVNNRDVRLVATQISNNVSVKQA